MKPKFPSRHLIAAGLSFAAIFSLVTRTQAATETWTGATTTWNTAGNWSGTNLPPVTGDSLIFGAAGAGGTALNNDLTSAAFTVAGITFNASASAFIIGGNAFTLSGGITDNAAAETINCAITLSSNQSFTPTVAGTLTLGGAITGTGVTLTTNGGTAGNIVAANTVFKGSVSLGSLVAQGRNTSGQVPASNQTTTFDDASLSTTGNVVMGRSNLVFKGTTTANITGNITTVGSASADWARLTLQDTASVTTAALVLTGSTATGQFALNGGTLTTGGISAIDSIDGTFTNRNILNGTQIIASQNNTAFLAVTKSAFFAGSNEVFVGNNGALFNSNGFSIRTATALVNDTAATGFLTKSGSGSLTLTGVSTYTGATTVNAGSLIVNGSLAVGSAVAVNGGASLGGTGTVNGLVTMASGSTAGTQGTINLVDAAQGTFTLSNAGGLTLGGTAGNLANLKFDVAAFTADLLSLVGNVLTVGAGGAAITITGTGVAAGNTYDLVNFGSGAGAGFATGSGTTVGALTLANPNLTFGVQGSLTVTSTAVQLVTSGASAPSTAYWSGVKGTTWASNDGTNGNFTVNPNGTGFVGAYPSSFTDVIFAANGNGAPVNLTNTLGQNFGINSLTFAGGTAAANISGGHQLTLDGGIILESGNGGATLAMTTLALGTFQTWSNASVNNLTVSAAITGANGLIIDSPGTGKIIFSGINSYSSGTTLTAGTLQLSGTGTLGAAAGSLTADAGTLDLNGTSQSVGAFGGTAGTILNNSSGTNVTLTVGTGNATGNYGGVIANNTAGTGTVAVTKTGTGTQTITGPNTYSGKTTVGGGTLVVGASETIPNASVLEINNGGKFNLQGFSETVGGLASTSSDINVVQNQETGGAGVGTLVIDTAGSDFTFTGIIRDNFSSTGTLALVKNGAGTETLKSTTGFAGPGTFNNFTGGLTINGGTLLLSDAGNGKLINSLSCDPNITATTANLALETTLLANTQTLAKIIGGSGNVVVTAANLGTIVLSQVNTYSGNTTVAGGTLSLTTASLSNTGALSVASGAFLNLTHSSTDIVGSLTLGGVLQPNGVYDASNSGGRISGTGAIQVGALGGFALWSSINAGGQASNLDFDNDGVENGVEYFMGQTGSSFTANPGIVNNKVTWPKDPAYLGSYTVQTSPDLTTWTDVASTVVGNTVEYSVPQNQGSLFVRLDVTPN